MRYLIRIEHESAFVFDRKKRFVFALPKEQVESILRVSSSEIPPVLVLDEHDFFVNDQVNYDLIELPETRGNDSDVCHSSAPNRLYLELTRACQLRCRMCYNLSGEPLPDELTTSEWKEILDQMASIGVFESRFTGGEPTCRPDFLTILDYALEKDFYVSLATNGIWSEELTREICSRPIDDVIVSLEGPPEINDRIRVGGCYDKTVATIAALKQAGIKKVRLNTVLSHLNSREVEPLFALCEQHDLLLIDFIHPRPFGRGEKAQNMMLSVDEVMAFNYLVEGLRKKYPTVKVIMDFDLLATKEPERHPIVPRIHACSAGREFAFVSPQGNVFPCGVAPVHDPSLMTPEIRELFVAGNVRDASISSIWHDSPVWQPYRDLKQCKPPKCFACSYWGKKCFGTCPIGAYYATGKLNGEDPYCFSHALPRSCSSVQKKTT